MGSNCEICNLFLQVVFPLASKLTSQEQFLFYLLSVAPILQLLHTQCSYRYYLLITNCKYTLENMYLVYSPHNYFTFIPDQALSWQSIDQSNVTGIGLDLMKKVPAINEVLERFKIKPQGVKVLVSRGDRLLNAKLSISKL